MKFVTNIITNMINIYYKLRGFFIKKVKLKHGLSEYLFDVSFSDDQRIRVIHCFYKTQTKDLEPLLNLSQDVFLETQKDGYHLKILVDLYFIDLIFLIGEIYYIKNIQKDSIDLGFAILKVDNPGFYRWLPKHSKDVYMFYKDLYTIFVTKPLLQNPPVGMNSFLWGDLLDKMYSYIFYILNSYLYCIMKSNLENIRNKDKFYEIKSYRDNTIFGKKLLREYIDMFL